MKLPLDHVGYYTADLDQAVRSFRAMGFSVVGPVSLATDASQLSPNTAVQNSAHIMFSNTYIELTSVTGNPSGHHLETISTLPPAIRLLLLECSDADQQAAKLRQGGVAVSGVQAASRELAYAAGERARFRWFAMPENYLPGMLCGYVQHLSRAMVFDRVCMNHANGVTGISALYLRPDAATTALALMSGGSTEMLPDQEQAAGWISGLRLQVHSLQQFRTCLDQSGICFDLNERGVRVAAVSAGGAFLQVEEGP